MTPYIAYPNGRRVAITTPGPITLEFAQGIVGGYVERVAPRKSPQVIFLCNEEGHVRGLRINSHGCDLYGGPIAGTIIVIPRSDPRHKEWL